MDPIWETVHATREWGKYPAEDLVRTVMRQYKKADRAQLRVLEVGCGAGANLHFLLNEGFQVYGIDGAPSAIDCAKSRLMHLKKPGQTLELVCQDFSTLPWADNYFDIVIDYLALYANRMDVIQRSLRECYRVLKPQGHFYSRSWADSCAGSQTGAMIEQGTSACPTEGPCQGLGVSHFFSEQEMRHLAEPFSDYQLRKLSDMNLKDKEKTTQKISEEWILWAAK